MKRQEDIIINQFQLNILLNEKEKHDYAFILEQGVFCATCMEASDNGIDVEEIHLDYLNDIRVVGTCKACGGKVARTMEFGENKDFFERANRLRETLKP